MTCQTCRERIAGRSGECHACREYRRRTGQQRPERIILRHLARRSQGGYLKVTYVRATISLTGGPSPEPVCVVCDGIDFWIRGQPLPLCDRHLGYARLAARLLEPHEVREALTA